MDRLDVKYKICGCWVHVCGNVWVQSMRMLGASLRRRLGACMRLLGASFIRLKACLTVGSYSLHAYPTSWAQGPPGAPGPVTKPRACNKLKALLQSLSFVTKSKLCYKV